MNRGADSSIAHSDSLASLGHFHFEPFCDESSGNAMLVWHSRYASHQSDMVCTGLQDLAMYNAGLASTAVMMYKSCVRTTIRLCNGVECQEKEGLFMLAFLHARDAVEWAVTLNIALLK